MSLTNNSTEILSGYNVHSSSDRKLMLKEIGLYKIEDLFTYIPENLKLKSDLKLPGPINEWELKKKLLSLSQKNSTTQSHLCLLGEGVYEHYIPSVVDVISQRGEFLTSYTPYQPEMSQGLLQVLFEYQNMISKLSDLPSVNCSMYDGATAMAEAAWMACLIKDRKKILASVNLWPQYKDVLNTYMQGRGVEITWVGSDPKTGLTQAPQVTSKDYAAFVIQTPNIYGLLENLSEVSKFTKANDCLFNLSYYPMLFGSFKSPGSYGVDILTCEGQSFGLPLHAGGAYLGILATHSQYVKYMPGRLVGKLMDLNGKRAYALIREEREQHVGRDKATSHICSNQALHSMRATIYLASIGAQGLQEISKQNILKAHYLCEQLCKIKGVSLKFDSPFFNEFTIKIENADLVQLLKRLEKKSIFAGIIVEDALRIAVTEVRSKKELDYVVNCFNEELSHG
jgi:glycine dehydrogenase subunit 1